MTLPVREPLPPAALFSTAEQPLPESGRAPLGESAFGPDPRVLAARARALAALAPLLHEHALASGYDSAVWTMGDGAAVLAAASRGGLPTPPLPAHLPSTRDTPDGPMHVAPLRGLDRTWLAVTRRGHAPAEASTADVAALDAQARFLAAMIGRVVGASVGAEQAAHELGERYEEINLLYSISETLGSAVSLERNARTILVEVSETVSAARAAIYLHERSTGTLQAIAAIGAEPDLLDPIAVGDARSAVARAFRTLHPEIVDGSGDGAPAEEALRAGAMLLVPIVWTGGTARDPLGVIVLSGRRHRAAFTAGDLKLVTAIASQVASAIQNARLVRASLQQQRHAQEMALAHDLQMRLLPRVDVVAPDAVVAARVVPAESVGGDFYHLFRLGEGRTGVLIGDVSGHGYRAALIMALAMSATAIHAQASADPAETLGAVLRSLREELESTEMYISCFYGVVDTRRGELRFANAGHPHAFVRALDGTLERLAAASPPLGLVDDAPTTSVRPWRAGEDLLVLFTDGVSDARGRDGSRLGEEPVLEAVRALRHGAPDAVAQRVFDVLEAHTGDAPPRDDLTFVALRS